MLTQIAAVFRLEWRKTFFSRRAWWIYLLAAGPVVITLLHWLVMSNSRPVRFDGRGHTMGDDSNIYAAMFQFFYLRGAIFFGCVGIFTNLFRGEMLEKTLHYYYMTPVRREVLVIGKFLAGLIVSLAVFVTSVAAAFYFMGRHYGAAYNDFIFHGPGLAQLGWYMLVAALACAGYGAVFLMCGLLYKNPMIPAAVVFVWENINPFLPSMLQKISVIFYLRSMLPVEIPVSGPFAVMVIQADPFPAWITIPGVLAVAGLVLAYTAVTARQAEISYGE
jgi:ABC-type transport system involved in multi-copper enzyme maturation permease subunit